MKYLTLKIYSVILLINALPLTFIGNDCHGYDCMIIYFYLYYLLIVALHYLPYLLIDTKRINSKLINSKKARLIAFFIPSAIYIVHSIIGLLNVIFSESTSTIEINTQFALIVFGVTTAHFVIQFLAYLYYSKKRAHTFIDQ